MHRIELEQDTELIAFFALTELGWCDVTQYWVHSSSGGLTKQRKSGWASTSKEWVDGLQDRSIQDVTQWDRQVQYCQPKHRSQRNPLFSPLSPIIASFPPPSISINIINILRHLQFPVHKGWTSLCKTTSCPLAHQVIVAITILLITTIINMADQDLCTRHSSGLQRDKSQVCLATNLNKLVLIRTEGW